MNLAGAFDAAIDSGVSHGSELVQFAAAIAGDDVAALTSARDALSAAMDPAAVTAASIITANFSMLDRAANAIGISVDSMIVKPSAGFRSELGINSYPSAANTPGAV